MLIYTGKRGRGESLIREKVRGAKVLKSGSKLPALLTVSPVLKL
jgi:hypothetical protein